MLRDSNNHRRARITFQLRALTAGAPTARSHRFTENLQKMGFFMIAGLIEITVLTKILRRAMRGGFIYAASMKTPIAEPMWKSMRSMEPSDQDRSLDSNGFACLLRAQQTPSTLPSGKYYCFDLVLGTGLGGSNGVWAVTYFIDFLKTNGLWEEWARECPLSYSSRNAPPKEVLLGTVFLAMLAGHKRYAHISTIRSDSILPALLGMKRVRSEDAIRRVF